MKKISLPITANRRSSLTFRLKPEVLQLSHGLAVRWDEKFRTKVTGFSTQVNFAKFLIILLMLAIASAHITLAAPNDPGHDTLYVLKIGDSNVTGSINISGNLTAAIVQATSRFFGPNLEIRGDGSASTVNQIIGTSTGLEISSPGSLILNKAVTGGTVYVGSTGTTTALNVTGALYVQSATATVNGKNICLADGTNCPSTLGGANATGSGTTGYLAQWQNASTLNSSVIFQNGSNIGIGTTSPGSPLTITTATQHTIPTLNITHNPANPGCAGCQNLGELIQVLDSGGSGKTNIGLWVKSVNAATNYAAIFESGNVGIGTTAPSQTLTVAGTGNITGATYLGNTKCSAGQVLTTDATSGLISCIAGTSSSSAGGWTNTSTTTSTSLDVNVDSGTLYVNSSSNRVGVGTATPSETLEVYGTVRSNYEYTSSVTFTDGWAANDYRNVVQVLPSSAGSSGFYEITIDGMRPGGYLAESSTYLAAIDHANADVWRETGTINDNSFVGGTRCFTIDTNGNYSNAQFRVRALKANTSCGNGGDMTINFKIRSIGRNTAWTALSGGGSGGTVTGFQSMAGNSWNLYTGNPFSGAGNLAISANSAGNVGIGTTTPSQKLHVAGSINVTQNITFSGGGYMYDNGTAIIIGHH